MSVANNNSSLLYQPDPVIEKVIQEKLRAYLTRVGQQDVELNVKTLMDFDEGLTDRFTYLVTHIPVQSRESILISGCAVGSEMILARRFGWERIVGTELNKDYSVLAGERLAQVDQSTVVRYDGVRLPFPSNSFSTVFSGHVIEHTRSPFRYFKEHIRVLKKGGYFFLEYPNRYHNIELHTNLPSVEYLPLGLRSLVLRYRASKFSKYSEFQRTHYKLILNEIAPMSIWQIELFTFFSLFDRKRAKVIHRYSPIKGYIRVLIRISI